MMNPHRPHGGESCTIQWTSPMILNNDDDDNGGNNVLTEQTAFTFYSLVFGFLGPLVFIFIFYLLVLMRFYNCLMSGS